MIVFIIYTFWACALIFLLFICVKRENKRKEKQKRINAMHRHHRAEQRFNLEKHVIVDEEFKDLFSLYEYIDIQHIVVRKKEYNNLKGIE